MRASRQFPRNHPARQTFEAVAGRSHVAARYACSAVNVSERAIEMPNPSFLEDYDTMLNVMKPALGLLGKNLTPTPGASGGAALRCGAGLDRGRQG
ncbi:MAG: hypothetical protein QOE37_2363 [Microbacteriaceae bacterium]|nr:hypothetical protein [Microbacteriaceae bacterium]